jgi:hypothetical protein
MSAADSYLLVSSSFLILVLSQNKLIADNVLVFFFSQLHRTYWCHQSLLFTNWCTVELL